MLLGQKFIDKQIISLDEGRIVGTVKDFYVNRELTHVFGLYLGSEGLLKRKPKVIKHEAIRKYGVDVLFVETSGIVLEDKALNDIEDLNLWLRRDDLQGREIQASTEAETEVGQVDDIFFDEQGKIVGFGLKKIKIEGPIAENLAIRREVVTEPGGDKEPMKIDVIKAEQQRWFFEGR